MGIQQGQQGGHWERKRKKIEWQERQWKALKQSSWQGSFLKRRSLWPKLLLKKVPGTIGGVMFRAAVEGVIGGATGGARSLGTQGNASSENW